MKTLTKENKKHSSQQTEDEFPGYPVYPPEEDIFTQYKEEDLSSEILIKRQNERKGSWNEKDFNEELTGEDLDIPGAELDDDQEIIGSEDEENNYYSLGGDNHENLEEYRGD